VPSEWAESWQRSWDRLEEVLVPDRERQISVLLDVVEAVAGTAPTVIDLACGTGTITCRLLDRLPRARSIAVDVDPVLLTICRATFVNDDRVHLVRADLRDPAWGEALPESQVDAVVTATALHWLAPNAVRRLYRDLAALVRPGGVVAHSERMPLAGLPRLGPALAEIDQQRTAGSDDRSLGCLVGPGSPRTGASARGDRAARRVRDDLSDRRVLAAGGLAPRRADRRWLRGGWTRLAFRLGSRHRRRPLARRGCPGAWWAS
jgi:SAM-dependent methyltransferase